ncbi:hypothetical protein E3N88_34996 [Mikania micrantha]|uniref:Chromo domain-containing protein n=1 Tax=Mikania micrantha TaxID=192012 RepID=A0A5N6M0M2_9ASTR|nr:hypothetical protein E3N88_34996 [Mikania micrantha]
MEDLVIDDELNYIEKPVAILDRKVKQLRNKTINQVMVQWQDRRGSDTTWESEDEMRKFYPFLFERVRPRRKPRNLQRLTKLVIYFVDGVLQGSWGIRTWRYMEFYGVYIEDIHMCIKFTAQNVLDEMPRIDSEGLSGTKRPRKEIVIEDSALEQGLGVSYGGLGVTYDVGLGKILLTARALRFTAQLTARTKI